MFHPLLTALAEMAAALLIAASVRPAVAARPSPATWTFLAVLVAAAGLGIAQLVPLPWSWWRALPGRDVPALVLQTAGMAPITQPLSLTPDATLRATLALLPPIAVLLFASAAPQARRLLLLLRMVMGAAVLGAVLGVVQFALDDPSGLVPFDTTHVGFGVGVFVNRNHQAAFLLAAMPLATMPGLFSFGEGPRNPRAERLWVAITASLLAFGVLATTSRTGCFLLPIVAAGTVALAAPKDGRRLLIGAAALLAVGLVLYRTPPVQQVLARFATAAEDERYHYWSNTLDLVRLHLPWGAGYGSFTTLYPTVEPLQQVKPDFVNHAHNDYLEALLDGGVAAVLLVGVALAALAIAAVLRLRPPARRGDRVAVLAPLLACGVLLACSAVDYPLRMTSLAALGALCAALVLQPAPRADPRLRGRASLPLGIALASVGVGLGALALDAGLSTALVLAGQPATAVRIARWDGSAWSALANERYLANDKRAAAPAARRALMSAPLDPVALRVLAFDALSSGQVARGEKLLGIGATLGWREGVTQAWLANRALEAGAVDAAVQRMDALLRQNKLEDLLLSQMRVLAASADGRRALAQELADRPGWRQAFVNRLAQGQPVDAGVVLPMLGAMHAAGAPATVTETALIRAALGDRADYRDAALVWRASGGTTLVGDGGFAESTGVMPTYAGPFAWRALNLPGTTVAVGPVDGAHDGGAATVISRGMASGPALAQVIVLAPGSYRLLSVAQGEDGARPLALGWRLRCLGGAGTDAEVPLAWAASGGGWWRGTGSVTVPTGCAGQELVATVSAPVGRSLHIVIDSVTLNPATVRK